VMGATLEVLGNAVSQGWLPPAGAEVTAHVDCDQSCWTDPAGWDFYPAPDAPIRQGGTSHVLLDEDWCGRTRVDPVSAGALQAVSQVGFGAVVDGFYWETSCAVPEDPGGGGGADPGGDGGSLDEDLPREGGGEEVRSASRQACGCTVSEPHAAWVLWLGLAVACRRR